MTEENTMIYLDSPDHFLGPSQNRYFGEGYRKTKHQITNLQIRDKLLIAKLSVKWPPVWSQKKGQIISPHIGSLDFFIVSELLIERYIRIIDNIKDPCIEKMWISNFSCKAGNQAIEHRTIPCSCIKLSQKEENNTLAHLYKIRINNVCALLTVRQQICRKNNRKCLSSCNGLATIILDKINKTHELNKLSYYNSIYKKFDRSIRHIEIYKDENRIKASVNLLNLGKSNVFGGIGKEYLPSITFCDLILVAGQLSQILLFNLEGIERDDAKNLWLRSIDCTSKNTIGNTASVEVLVCSSEILCIDRKYYRNVVLEFNFNGGDLFAKCKAAYQIS
jgi:hypothetical protein